MNALRLRNTSDVVFSASSATAGRHETLRHVPGSALWGAAAARFYAAEPGAQFETVHSTKLRFTPAFPISPTGLPGFPIPQSFNQPKHSVGGIDAARITGNVVNLAAKGAVRDGPLTPMRHYYLAVDGSVFQPKFGERGKTAVEPGGRRASESQYFQYQYLQTGQRFVCWVDGPVELVERICLQLSTDRLRLGRSGMKEFGGAFEVQVDDLADPRNGCWKQAADDEIILWCLSDVACIDEHGSPDFMPSPASLIPGGFPGRIEPARSVVSTRRYAPYNGYLGTIDREHCVIEAGSVLVYSGCKGVPLEVFREGVGLWRERGLGLVWPNAPMLMSARPLDHAAPTEVPPPTEPAAPRSDLTAEDRTFLVHLKSRQASSAAAAEQDEQAEALATALRALVAALRNQGEEPPSASQWGLVANLVSANAGRTPADILRLLTDENGPCVGARNREWAAFVPVFERRLSTGDKPISVNAFERALWKMRAEQSARE